MDNFSFKLKSPPTEEDWDRLMDVDFDHTNEVTFHTKNGKDVKFIKEKQGEWVDGKCSVCGRDIPIYRIVFKGEEVWRNKDSARFCPNCGARMEENN